MINKKILSLIIALGVFGSAGFFVLKHHVSAESDGAIKVMDYKPSTKVNEKGYQIDKYNGIESAAWINENEVLVLKRKGQLNNPNSIINIRYCSVYNLNTKKSRDFKNVDMDEFLGMSPDKKYVLYAEPRVIPKVQSDEWKRSLDSGALLHKNVKLLNLSTGKITDVNTEKINSDAQFIWVSSNKILANYFHNWSIIDITGKVYSKGSYNGEKYDDAWISGVDDVKDMGNSVKGKFYYTQYKNGQSGVNNTELGYVNVETKAAKTIFSNYSSMHADKKNSTIIMDKYNDGAKKDGIYPDRTFGAFILNESGKVLREINLSKGKSAVSSNTSEYVLSPDGSKAVYVEMDSSERYIKIIDTHTGTIKEIVSVSSLKEKNEKDNYVIMKVTDEKGNVKERKFLRKPSISNICWNNTGDSLSFTYGDSSFDQNNIRTYIVSFDR